MKRHALSLLIGLAIMACSPQDQRVGNAAHATFEPEIERSLRIRRDRGQPIPMATSAIYIDSVVAHHNRSEASTIVWRDDDGHWLWSQVAETASEGSLEVDRRLDYALTRQLSENDAGTLDRLLEARSLFRGDARLSGEPNVGAAFHVMEIVTPRGRVVYRWTGRLLGEAGMIADLALKRTD